MTAFLWRPPIRRTIQTIFWATTGIIGAALFIAAIHLIGAAFGAPYC